VARLTVFISSPIRHCSRWGGAYSRPLTEQVRPRKSPIIGESPSLMSGLEGFTVEVENAVGRDVPVLRVPAGPGALIAQWGQNSPATGAERNTYSVGYLYPLSKLTELYATAMKDELDGQPSGHSYSAGMRLRF